MDSIPYFNLLSRLSVAILTVGMIVEWFHRRYKLMTILTRNGIPGNTPHIIFGNLFEKKGLSMVDRQKKLIEKYGKIVGYYTGAKPNILVADPELAKRVLIKDFHNFTNRSIFLEYINPSPNAGESIFLLRDHRWKQIRSLLSPAFSVSKLKGMTPIMESSVDSFLQIISKKSETGEEFNIYELYLRLTVETILKTAFGVQIDAQNDNNNTLLMFSLQFVKMKVNKLVLFPLVCFPQLAPLIHYLKAISQHISSLFKVTGFAYLWVTCTEMIRLRKDHPAQRVNDILQAMLDSTVNEEDISDVLNDRLNTIYEENEENSKNTEQNNIKPKIFGKKVIKLTEDEIKMNCMSYLVAGFDTTSAALAFVTHNLINYPKIQEKVRKEVIDLYESEGKLDYNIVSKLQYMEWVIDETLRIYPPLVIAAHRECANDYKYKNITIPKGANVVMCTHLLHNDPDYWSEPQKFDPMRFSPERRHEIQSGTWHPFGDGPRKCIGSHFAYLNIKLTLAKLLLEYSLEAGTHSERGRLAIKYKPFTVIPEKGVFVKVVKN